MFYNYTFFYSTNVQNSLESVVPTVHFHFSSSESGVKWAAFRHRAPQFLRIFSRGGSCVRVRGSTVSAEFLCLTFCIKSVKIQENPMCEHSRGSSTDPLSECVWAGGGASNTGHKHEETKTNVSGEEVLTHDEDTDEEVKRVGGDQSWRRVRWCEHDHVTSAAEVTGHFLSLSAAPGCPPLSPEPGGGSDAAELFSCETQSLWRSSGAESLDSTCWSENGLLVKCLFWDVFTRLTNVSHFSFFICFLTNHPEPAPEHHLL